MLDNAFYGITALRYVDGRIDEALMGLVDAGSPQWEYEPAPTRLVEVVDRLLEGDRVVALFPTAGGLEAGPEVKVDVLPGGAETLSLASEGTPGRSLQDLPRF